MRETGYDWINGPRWSMGWSPPAEIVRPPRRSRWHALPILVVLGLLLALLPAFVPSAETAEPIPNRETCEGYPEKRVWIENQGWWGPQAPRAGFPASGQTGHIHVGLCWPLFQHLTAPTLALDVKIMSHDMTEVVQYGLRIDAYDIQNGLKWGDDGKLDSLFKPLDCASGDCEKWMHIDYPVGNVPASGLRAFYIFPIAFFRDQVRKMFPYASLWAYVDNGKPAGVPVGDTSSIEATHWFPRPPEGGSNYARTFLSKPDLPWDTTTLEPRVKSGIWTIKPRCQCNRLRVLIDPAFHADPPREGIVESDTFDPVARARPPVTVNIDTTKLSNGPHRLVILGTFSSRSDGESTGVLAVSFQVQNDPPPPTTTMPTTTTTTMPSTTSTTTPTTSTTLPTTTVPPTTTTMPMYHPACEPTCDEQIATLKDRIARARTILQEP